MNRREIDKTENHHVKIKPHVLLPNSSNVWPKDIDVLNFHFALEKHFLPMKVRNDGEWEWITLVE